MILDGKGRRCGCVIWYVIDAVLSHEATRTIQGAQIEAGQTQCIHICNSIGQL